MNRAYQHHGQAAQARRQKTKQVQGRTIGPLQIVDREQENRVPGESAYRLQNLIEETPARIRLGRMGFGQREAFQEGSVIQRDCFTQGRFAAICHEPVQANNITVVVSWLKRDEFSLANQNRLSAYHAQGLTKAIEIRINIRVQRY